jgi:protein transport protein SEC61 subunit alpha
MTKPSKTNALYQSFTRPNNPNLSQFFGTVFIFCIIIYLQGFKKRIPLIHQRHKGYTSEIKVKLFYTSNMSVILQSMLVSNFYNISSILYSRFSKSILVKFFGVWENGKVTNGLMRYISPPENFADLVMSPIRTVTYLTFICVSCAFFAR